MDYAISGYPLSQSYRHRLEESLDGSPTYLQLSDLRRLPFAKMIARLLRLNADRLVIAVENESSRALLPAFMCIAAVAKSKRIEVAGPDLKMERISRWRSLKSIGNMLLASVDGWRSLRRSRRQLAKLLTQDRLELPPLQPGRVLYAKGNLTLGVTAGGSVGHVAGVVRGLLEHGYPVDFHAVEPPAVLDSRAEFHQVDPPATYGLPYDSNLYRYQNKMVREICDNSNSDDYSFVYQRMAISNFSGVTLSRKLNLPLVIEYNGSEVWISKNWDSPLRHRKLAEQAEDACLKHAHAIVTVSNVLRDELIERGVDPDRIATYPNCVETDVYNTARFSKDELNALRDKHNIPRDAVIAAFVGTFGPWHGAEVLAKTIRDLGTTNTDWLRKKRVHFLFVGDGTGMNEVRETLDHGACRSICTITGLVPQAETPKYVAASDIMLSPHVSNSDGSRFFGSPTKLFEYMAMGKAIIASDLEQIGEVLEDSLRIDSSKTSELASSNLAVLCKPGCREELRRAIECLVEHPTWRKQLGENARREASQKYTWDKHVGAILERLK